MENKNKKFFKIISELTEKFQLSIKNKLNKNKDFFKVTNIKNNKFDIYFQEALKKSDFNTVLKIMNEGYIINANSQKMLDNLLVASLFSNFASMKDNVKSDYNYYVKWNTSELLEIWQKIVPSENLFLFFKNNESILNKNKDFAVSESEYHSKHYRVEDFIKNPLPEDQHIYSRINFELLKRGFTNNNFERFAKDNESAMKINPYFSYYFLQKEREPDLSLSEATKRVSKMLDEFLVQDNNDTSSELKESMKHFDSIYNSKTDYETFKKEESRFRFTLASSILSVKISESYSLKLETDKGIKDLLDYAITEDVDNKNVKKNNFPNEQSPDFLFYLLKKNILTFLAFFKPDVIREHIPDNLMEKLNHKKHAQPEEAVMKLKQLFIEKNRETSNNVLTQMKFYNEQVKIKAAFTNKDNEAMNLLTSFFNVQFLENSLIEIRDKTLEIKSNKINIETENYVNEVVKKVFFVLENYQEISLVLPNVDEKKDDFLVMPLNTILNSLIEIQKNLDNQNMQDLKNINKRVQKVNL